MSVLYVTEKRAVVRKRARSLIVTHDEDPDGSGPLPEIRRTLAEMEPHAIEVVALFDDVHITSEATRLCLEEGIDVAWFDWRGDYLGRLGAAGSRSADLRLRQYGRVSDGAFRLERARAIVDAKLDNALATLADLRGNRPGDPTLEAATTAIRRTRSESAAVTDVEVLLGIEGNGARAYFSGIAACVPDDLGFAGRKRRPPPDPLNAMLSFGYVLMMRAVTAALEARGLDPALGMLHEHRPGRASLALDLMEELRHPVVDRLAVRIANLRILGSGDFEPDDERPGGIRFSRPALRRFLAEWERQLARPLREKAVEDRLPVRDLIHRQVERMAGDLRGGAPYAPFRYGR